MEHETYIREGGFESGFSKGGIPLARPGSDTEVIPMSRKDAILNMRQVLIKRRDALRKALAGDLSLLKELRAQSSGDVVDAALDSVQDEISSQLAEVESRELSRIEYALDRMRNGQFGLCESCNTAIPMARLNALPYATFLHQVPAGNGTSRSLVECRRRLEPLDRFRLWRRGTLDQRYRDRRLLTGAQAQ